MDFSLSDQVYARARVSDVQAVNLWLGAGVMLEYTLEAAQALLVSTHSMRLVLSGLVLIPHTTRCQPRAGLLCLHWLRGC